MSGKGVVRSIKNYAKGFSEVQIKVREATSNDPWGPSGTLMNEIAQLTNNQHDFVEIMDMIDRRLNDKGKNWRHVFKALLLLDYCLHVGSENVVLYAKENIYVVKTLKEFQHIDDSGKDVGANVRQKAKSITDLLNDDARLREERRQRTQMRDRMTAVGDYMNETLLTSRAENGEPVYERPGYLDEDKDLRRAIEESRRLAQEEAKKREQGDEDLAKALQLSEQEAREKEKRQREKLERENEQSLFGNAGNDQSSSFNPFPQNQLFDASVNPYAQQQQFPQPTGMTNMSFSDPVSANQMYNQQQATGFGNNFGGNPYGNNPYQQQQQGFAGFGQGLQAQMTGMPQQPQYTGMAPFQTSDMSANYQQAQFTGMPSIQTSMATGMTSNPFGQYRAGNEQLPQQTGFASTAFQQPQQTGMANFQPQASPSFASTSTTNNQSPSSSGVAAFGSPSTSKPADPRYAKLNALLASKDDGMDTFGNTGNLRIPYGTGFANSLQPQATGQSSATTATGNTGDLLGLGTDNKSNDSKDSLFSQPFGQQPSRNPFGQPTVNNSSPNTNNNQKSLLEMMQEQRQQQQQQQQQPASFQQPQMTGMMQPQPTGFDNSFAFGQPQQPQMTGMQQPQATGFNGFGQASQPAFGQQNGSFF
ncbi:uncharacterized protein BYT42DRAFT_615385 [Radiomyces spectabilis]|uniref:uncharacterized protein n=1 Tax=Radiomyces spectabilis TaxID=64574 RepID=UPI00221EB601|nr:uncharacterized protein BYT42DRAFT_615385 [Radiomyces spectabilis]KAI8374207.1 hypothetical protein BYT42DRAFT_615385 [Radiomyces spectabilis]